MPLGNYATYHQKQTNKNYFLFFKFFIFVFILYYTKEPKYKTLEM